MIELVNVEKTYHTSSGDIHALKRTSLTINQGEIFGIIGLSGAGKSTLIRCINMLEVPTAGQVFVDGEELTAMTETQLRKARQNIGMIFQHFNLLASRTVFDNIAFPLEIQGLGKDEIKKRVPFVAKSVTYIKVLARGKLSKPLVVVADDFSLEAVKNDSFNGRTRHSYKEKIKCK